MGFLDRLAGALGRSRKPKADFGLFVAAANKGDVSAFRRALDSDTDVVSRTDHERMTILHYTAAIGNTEVAGLLLDAGAAVDAGNATGWTPLHFAALQGHEDMAALLVKRGARIDAQDGAGQTPLEVAHRYKWPKVVKVLTKRRKRQKPTVEQCVQEGKWAGERQDWPASIDAFKRAVKIDPDCAEAHCGLTLAYAAVLDAARAKKHYSRLQELNPDLAAKVTSSPVGAMVARVIGLK